MAATGLLLLLPGETRVISPFDGTYKTGTATAQTAGVPFNVQVFAIDENTGDVDTGCTDVVFLNYGGDEDLGVLPSSAALVAGQVTLSVQLNAGAAYEFYLEAQNQTDPGMDFYDNGYWAEVVVNSGAFAKLQLLLPSEAAAPGTASGRTGGSTTILTNVPLTLRVNAVDAYWNPVSSTHTVEISSSGTATLPADAALVAGTKQFQFTSLVTTGAAITITASDVTDPSKSSDVRSVTAGIYVPAGSLCFSSYGVGIVFLNPVTFAVVAKISPVDASGGVGVQTSTGKWQFATANYPLQTAILTPQLELLAYIAPPEGYGSFGFPDGQATFWACHRLYNPGGPPYYSGKVYEIDESGILQTLDVPSVTFFNGAGNLPSNTPGVANDDSFLLTTIDNGLGALPVDGGESRLYKITLPGGSLSSFCGMAATPSGTHPGLYNGPHFMVCTVLQDNKVAAVVSNYTTSAGDTTTEIRVFDASGGYLYTVSTSGYPYWVTRGATAATFWLGKTVTQYGFATWIVEEIDTATGAVLKSQDVSSPVLEGSSNPSYFRIAPLDIGSPAGPTWTAPTLPPTVPNNSDPCCGSTAGPGGIASGMGDPVGPDWIPECVGLGEVPSAADLTASEAWDV